MGERGHSALGPATRRVRAQWRALVGSVERRDATRGEGGFMLLESIVAIGMISVLLAALGGFTLTSIKAVDQLRARQAAAQLSTTAMAGLQTMPATDLITGRGSKAVKDQRDDAELRHPLIYSWLTDNQGAYNADYTWSDGSVPETAGANANISTDPQTPKLNNITYSVRTYLGLCKIASTTSTTCAANGTGLQYVRAVIAVTWGGNGCAASECAYVTSTLISTADDPVFNTNLATVPSTPIVDKPGNQVSSVGATIGLQLGVVEDTGVPPYTWQLSSGTLPSGITLSASGLFTGSPTTPVNAAPLRVTVIDAFGRAGTETFTWTVKAAPTITTPTAQTSNLGQSVSLTPTYTCPYQPCTFALSGAPAGLSIGSSTGAITGTPTAVGPSPAVVVTVTSADGVPVSTQPFTWTVVAAATIDSPGTRRITVGQTESVAIGYTCPSTPCTVTLTGGLPGVGLSTSASTTGNNTTTSVSVSSTSGILYLAGTAQTGAVTSGTSTAYQPTVKIAKGSISASASGTWTAFSRPTLTGLGNRTVAVNGTADVAVTYTCPNSSCTITLGSTVPGIGLSATSGVDSANATATLTVSNPSGTVYLSGKVPSSAVPGGQSSKSYPVALSIVDADAATASASGTWTVGRAPQLVNPGTQVAMPNKSVSLQLDGDCPNGGCSWTAEKLYYGYFWVSVPISSSGKLNVSGDSAGTYPIRVTVTDASGATDQVTFSLVVSNFSLSIANQSDSNPRSGITTVTLDVSTMINPRTSGGYSWSLSGAPSWLTIDSATGLLTARIGSSSRSDSGITVTATSLASPTSSVSDTFGWTLR